MLCRSRQICNFLTHCRPFSFLFKSKSKPGISAFPSISLTTFSRASAGFKETAFLYAISSAGLTHAMAKACSAGRMERCTCDEAPDLENRKAWQWGGCGDNLKYANKFVKDFLGKRSNKDLRARVDMHNTNVGMKVNDSAIKHQSFSKQAINHVQDSDIRIIEELKANRYSLAFILASETNKLNSFKAPKHT